MHVVAADPFDGVLERVERGRDRDPAPPGSSAEPAVPPQPARARAATAATPARARVFLANMKTILI